MSDSAKYITIRKVIKKSKSIEDDTILLNDIKSFRDWHKDEEDKSFVNGDMCVVNVLSITGKDGFYPIYINESAKSFGQRLGPGIVIPNKEDRDVANA